MNRRDFLTTSATTSLLFASGAYAADKKKPETKAAPASNIKYARITQTTADCIKTGEACLNHCMMMIDMGDTNMKECMKGVMNMLAVTKATLSVASLNNAKPQAMKALISACEAHCQACADSCKPFAAQHDVCKACLDACDACVKACRESLTA